MDIEQLNRYKKNFKSAVIFATVLLMLLGFYSGAYSKSESLDVINTLAGLPDYIIANPLKLYPVNWFFPLMFGIIAGVVDLKLYFDYIRRRNSLPDKEHGTSKFNDNMPKFRREFIYDPKICVKKKRFRQRIDHLIYFLLSFLPYWKDNEDDMEEEDE